MPAIGLLIGGVNFTDLKIILKQAVMDGDKVVSPAVSINYGNFLQVTFDFIIIAFSIFMLVKGINALNKKKEEAPAEPTTKTCPFCQSEISIKATRCPHCTSVLEEKYPDDFQDTSWNDGTQTAFPP